MATVITPAPEAGAPTDATYWVSSASGDLSNEVVVSSLPSATVAATDKIIGLDVNDSDNPKTFTAQSIADLASSGLAFGNSPDSQTTYTSHPFAVGSSSASGTGSGTIYYSPVSLAKNTYTRIGINVATTGLVGSEVARLGIYNVNANGAPSTLVLDAGTVSITTTGEKEITINQELGGKYFLAFCGNGAINPTADTITTNLQGLWGVTTSTGSSDIVGMSKGSTTEYNALSNPALTGLTLSTATSVFRVWVRA